MEKDQFPSLKECATGAHNFIIDTMWAPVRYSRREIQERGIQEGLKRSAIFLVPPALGIWIGFSNQNILSGVGTGVLAWWMGGISMVCFPNKEL